MTRTCTLCDAPVDVELAQARAAEAFAGTWGES